MEQQAFGIQETKDVIIFGMDVAIGVGSSLADDGKITGGDAHKFTPALFSLPGAITGIDQLPKELAELNEAEMEEIKALVLEKGAAIPGIQEKWLKVAAGAIKAAQGIREILVAVKS